MTFLCSAPRRWCATLKNRIINVNAQKHITNSDKGKLLMAARKRLGLSQVQMAQRLNLDSTYLSQLENGRREVDEFYVQRAEEMAREFENVNRPKVAAGEIRESIGHEGPSREGLPGVCAAIFGDVHGCGEAGLDVGGIKTAFSAR